ncbi:hypothetical protein D3C76_630290 [compost metagenome]
MAGPVIVDVLMQSCGAALHVFGDVDQLTTPHARHLLSDLHSHGFGQLIRSTQHLFNHLGHDLGQTGEQFRAAAAIVSHWLAPSD